MSGMGAKHSRSKGGDTPEKDSKKQAVSGGVTTDTEPEAGASEEMCCETTTAPTAGEIAAANAARERLGHTACSSGDGSAVVPDKLPDGPEPVIPTEIEYIQTEDLLPLVNLQEDAQVALQQLQSKNWIEACKGVTAIRQLIVHHRDYCRPLIEQLVPLVLAHVKSLRSSLSKMAIMCVSDLFSFFGGDVLPLLDVGGVSKPATSLLHQLLLKASSNDKRFVIESVLKSLETMTANLDAAKLLDLLLPYAQHKNPKVRGRAALTLTAAISRLSPQDLATYGADNVLKATARWISDNTPEAREAARQLVPRLQSAHEQLWKQAGGEGLHHSEEKENQVEANTTAKRGSLGLLREGIGNIPQDVNEPEKAVQTPWEAYCYQSLNATSANAILKAST